MKKTILFAFMLVAGLMHVSAQNVYYVYSTGDDSDGLTPGTAFKTPVKAVNLITDNTPTTIYLEPNATFEIASQLALGGSGSPYWAVDVELIGDNTTIQLPETNTANRAFRIATDGVVKMTGLNIKNGAQGAVGGGIYFAGKTLEIDKCVFENNQSRAGGGAAIASVGNNLTIKNSYFKNNRLTGTVYGTVLQLGNASGSNTLTIENTTFEGNRLTSGDGRGTAVSTFTTAAGSTAYKIDPVIIRNCTFLNNNLTVDGNGNAGMYGVIHLGANAPASNVFVVNNTFLATERYSAFNNAVRIEGTGHKLHLVNNVIAGLRHGIVAGEALASRQPISATNNIFVCFSPKSNAVTDPDLANDNTKNNSVTPIPLAGGSATADEIAVLEAAIAELKMETSLSLDEVVPYLKITDKSSPLVDAGINTYVSGTEFVPATDIIGTTRADAGSYTGSSVDIGAFEFVGGTQTSLIGVESKDEPATVYQDNGTLTIQSNTDKNVTVKILRVDGRQLYAASVQGSVSIAKSELSDGILLVVISDGTTTSVKKIAL